MATYAIGHLESVRALAGSGRILAIGGTRADATSAVTLFDAGTRKVTRTLQIPTHTAALAFFGKQLVVGGIDGQLFRFDAASGEAAGSAIAHAGGVTSLAASGALLASTGVDGKVTVWSEGTKKYEFVAPCPQRAVALDPENNRVASAGDDGVVRLFTFGQKAPREMEGHRGTVTALSFTPRDGRLASSGDDGTVRFWYLEGAVECEVRGEGDTGHAGGATGFAFLPSWKDGAKDLSDRLVSTGLDAKVRTVRLDDKKRSKTFDAEGQQRAIALVESDPRKSLIEIVVGGDGRKLTFIEVSVEGALPDTTHQGLDGFTSFAAQLNSAQRAAKEVLARDLPKLREAEALPLLEALSRDREDSVRLTLAKTLKGQPRKDTRALLRALVKDKDAAVAQAGLEALSVTEEQPFLAYREGLRAAVAAVRIFALKSLAPLYPAVPLVPALVAGLLKDSDPTVRLAALDALQVVFPQGVEALVTGFEKGTADVRAEVLVRALFRESCPRCSRSPVARSTMRTWWCARSPSWCACSSGRRWA